MRHTKAYQSPGVIQTVDVALEQAFLAGSIVDAFNAGGINTSAQPVENKNFDDGFNFVWE